jgi:hypothetical protein
MQKISPLSPLSPPHPHKRHTPQRLLLCMAALVITTAASCNMSDKLSYDFEYTGQVLDEDTKLPIEGAYVLAVYERVDLGMAGSARYCVKTKGMLTGKDGKFNFPMEKIRGSISPAQVAAIKTDYYSYRSEDFTKEAWEKQDKDTYSNRHVYLKRQDPAKLEFRYGYTTCKRPESREAVEANIEFLKIKRIEMTRIASKFDWFPSFAKDNDAMIRYLEDTTYTK